MDLFIKKMLQRCLDDNIIDIILSKYYNVFEAAFTTRDYNQDENYEYFEQLGDLSINKFIVTYMGRRFSQLKSSSGVSVLATLRILYGSKDILSQLSEKYGMDKYVKCSLNEIVDKLKMTSILEDIFEAFIGAVEYCVDKIWYEGVGYIIVYKLLESIFDEINIQINYEYLVDAKSRLNELKEEYKMIIKYEDIKTLNGQYETKLYLTYQNFKELLIGTGIANTKKLSQTIGADNALKWIKNNLKIIKQVPDRYKIISDKIW